MKDIIEERSPVHQESTSIESKSKILAKLQSQANFRKKKQPEVNSSVKNFSLKLQTIKYKLSKLTDGIQ